MQDPAWYKTYDAALNEVGERWKEKKKRNTRKRKGHLPYLNIEELLPIIRERDLRIEFQGGVGVRDILRQGVIRGGWYAYPILSSWAISAVTAAVI